MSAVERVAVPAASEVIRLGWDRFVSLKKVADASLSYEDGAASALAFWDFVSTVGSADGLVSLVGSLVAPEDPLAGLLWSIATDIRRGGPSLLRSLALRRELLRSKVELEMERAKLLDHATAAQTGSDQDEGAVTA